MKKNFVVLLVVVLVLGLSNWSWSQCPEDPNDLGICDTLHVEPWPYTDTCFTAGFETICINNPGEKFPCFWYVSLYVTHDSNTFWWEDNEMWVQDSIAAFVTPLTFWLEREGCAHKLVLPTSNNWNNTEMSPSNPKFPRSIFRHIVDEEGDTVYNRFAQMVGQSLEPWSVWRDIDTLASDGDAGHFFMAVTPMWPECRKWWEGNRVLLATHTFMVYPGEDCDTMFVGVDSTFWPPTNELSFTRTDAAMYFPRHLLPVKDTIYIPRVKITNPPDYRIYANAQESTIVITGTASDPDGTVDHIDIRIDHGDWVSVPGIASWSYSWDITGVTDGEHTIHARSIDNEGVSSDVDSVLTFVNKMVFLPPYHDDGTDMWNALDWVGLNGGVDDHDSYVSHPLGVIYADASSWASVLGISALVIQASMRAMPKGYGAEELIHPGDGFTVNSTGTYRVTFDLHSEGFCDWYIGGLGNIALGGGVKSKGWIFGSTEQDPGISPIEPIGGYEDCLYEGLTFGTNLYEQLLLAIFGNLPWSKIIKILIAGYQSLPEVHHEPWINDDPLTFRVCLQDGDIGYFPHFRLDRAASTSWAVGAIGGATLEIAENLIITSITVEFESSCLAENTKKETKRNNVKTNTRVSGLSNLIVVDDEGDGDYTIIQAAIDNANPGDRIEVYSGTYYENLLIDKKLSLVGMPYELGSGADTGAPILDASLGSFRDQNCNGICINADSCAVDSFKIVNSELAGIALDGGSYNTISNNTLFDNYFSIQLANSSNNNIFSNNTMTNNQFGVWLSDSSNENAFSYNIFEYQVRGIWIFNSNQNDFSNNNLSKNGGGVFIIASSNNIFSNNEIGLSGDGFILANSSNNELTYNTIDTCYRHGVHLSESFDNVITGNTFVTRGISFSEISGGLGSQTIENNTINGKPIYYYSNMDGVSVPSDAGQVILMNCTNFTIQSLTISEVDYGIQLLSSSGNNISQCAISDNLCGILLSGSTNNTISNNSFSNNTWSGVLIMDSPNNQLMTNTFTNDGITLSGDSLSSWNTQTIQGNTVNDKPIYYYADMDSVTVPSDAGQVILANCAYFEIEYATISNVEYGIQLAYSSNSVISNNDLSENLYGFVLHSSDDNTIKNNNFDSSGSYGIRVCSGTGNLFWNNSFVGNPVSACEDSNVTGNLWDNGEVGNTWDDFPDNPGYPSVYYIHGPGDGVDNYPSVSLVRGDANGDGKIDIADVVHLVNYLFIDGPAPNPLWLGDANCDEVVDIADVVYLINYLFTGGPPPGCL